MRAGQSGFDSLSHSWTRLGAPGSFVRVAPPVTELPAWIDAHAAEGFLIAHDVLQAGRKVGVHITVVFSDNGQLIQADPGHQALVPVTVQQLQSAYAGDVAYMP